jgi:hypothetical protein
MIHHPQIDRASIGHDDGYTAYANTRDFKVLFCGAPKVGIATWIRCVCGPHATNIHAFALCEVWRLECVVELVDMLPPTTLKMDLFNQIRDSKMSWQRDALYCGTDMAVHVCDSISSLRLVRVYHRDVNRVATPMEDGDSPPIIQIIAVNKHELDDERLSETSIIHGRATHMVKRMKGFHLAINANAITGRNVEQPFMYLVANRGDRVLLKRAKVRGVLFMGIFKKRQVREASCCAL